MAPNNFKDLNGLRFGRLIVVERAPNIPRRGRSHSRTAWKVHCDCGVEKIVTSSDLRDGRTRSCGCYRDQRRFLPPGVAAFNALNLKYRKDSEYRGIIFSLSESEFRQLTQGNCFYCGIVPAQVWDAPGGDYTYNGIDRMDSDGHYTVENCVSCCWKCNEMKMGKTVAKFIAACKAVAKHHDN